MIQASKQDEGDEMSQRHANRLDLKSKLDALESLQACPGCSVADGEQHREGCNFAFCITCGHYRVECGCSALESQGQDHWDAAYHLYFVGLMTQEMIWTGRGYELHSIIGDVGES